MGRVNWNQMADWKRMVRALDVLEEESAAYFDTGISKTADELEKDFYPVLQGNFSLFQTSKRENGT